MEAYARTADPGGHCPSKDLVLWGILLVLARACLKHQSWANERAEWVKVLLSKLSIPSLIQDAHEVDGENQPMRTVL